MAKTKPTKIQKNNDSVTELRRSPRKLGQPAEQHGGRETNSPRKVVKRKARRKAPPATEVPVKSTLKSQVAGPKASKSLPARKSAAILKEAEPPVSRKRGRPKKKANTGSSTMSLMQTARAKHGGSISWDDYIHNLLARVGGVKFEENDVEEDYYYDDLREIDRFAWSIWSWSDEYDTIKDTSPLEAVFTAYRHGTFTNVETKLNLLNSTVASSVRKSLALLALQERRADVLKLCLEQGGFDFEPSFRVEASEVDGRKDPQTLGVLRDSEFGRLWPSEVARPAACYEGPVGAPPGTGAIFNNDGKLPVDW